MNHDVTRWHLRQNPNFDRHSQVQVSAEWTSALSLCISLFCERVVFLYLTCEFQANIFGYERTYASATVLNKYHQRIQCWSIDLRHVVAHFPFSFVPSFPPRSYEELQFPLPCSIIISLDSPALFVILSYSIPSCYL